MKNEKKYIFLDIDGVLNAPGDKIIYEMFEEKKLQLLLDFLVSDNFLLVITSSRRIFQNDRDIIKKVFDPFTNVSFLSEKRLYKYRGQEIEFFIIENNVENFVIFDDVDSGISKIAKLSNKFILVDYLTGLTKNDIEKAKIILAK